MKKLLLISLLLPIQLFSQTGKSVTYEEFNRTLPPLDCAGRIKTHNSGDICADRWSVGCECLDRKMAEWSEFGKYVSMLGVGYSRIQSGWARTETKKGKYDYSWLDEIVDGLVGQNVKPWISLCYGNPLYGTETTLGATIFKDDKTFAAWDKYVENTVARYCDRVHVWEIWNEPNISSNTPESYVKLIEHTCRAIRKVDSSAKIAAFALASVDRKFLNAVLDILSAKNERDLFDIVTFHKYYENPDDGDYDFAVLTEDVHRFNPSLKVVMGESGCPSKLEFGHALKHYQFDEKIQAKTILRRMACDFAAGRPCSVFTMVDLVYPDMQQSFGLLRTNLQSKVIYAKPSFYAVRNMVNLLPDSIEPFEIEFNHNSSKTIKAVGLRRSSDKSIAGVMFYFCDDAPLSSLQYSNVTVTFKNLKIKAPLFVEPVTGKVFKLGNYHRSPNSPDEKFTNLPIWDSPLFLMSSEYFPAYSTDNATDLNEF